MIRPWRGSSEVGEMAVYSALKLPNAAYFWPSAIPHSSTDCPVSGLGQVTRRQAQKMIINFEASGGELWAIGVMD
jgi:hypothetical protein